MPCRHPATLPITWVSPWDVVCMSLPPLDPVAVWGSPWVAEAKGLKPSKEGGRDSVFVEAVTWGAGGCKNILPNFSFCF